jgi:hypothetical protein
MRRGEKSQSKQDGKLNGTMSWRQCLRGLYEADTTRGHRFRYGLLVFDLITIAFIIVTSFLPYLPAIEELDVLFGIAILADFAARPGGTSCIRRPGPMSRPSSRFSRR